MHTTGCGARRHALRVGRTQSTAFPAASRLVVGARVYAACVVVSFAGQSIEQWWP